MLESKDSEWQFKRVDADTMTNLIEKETTLESVLNQELRGRIDQEYTAHPFYGSRRMTTVLRRAGYPVNRNRVIRLMTEMGLQAIYPKPATSTPHPDHQIYPYLLRGVIVTVPDQVWSTDITYIHLPGGLL